MKHIIITILTLLSISLQAQIRLNTKQSFVDSTRLVSDSILVYYQNGNEIRRDTIVGTGGGAAGAELSVYQEEFVADGVDSTYKVTKSTLPTNVSNIIVSQNGLVVDEQYISKVNSTTIRLSYLPDSADNIVVIWFLGGGGSGGLSSVSVDSVTIYGDGLTTPLYADTAKLVTTSALNDSINNSLSGYVTISGTETITGAKTFTANTVFDDSTLYVDATTNRVGIGTSTPSQKLTLSGPLSRMDFALRDVGGISTHNIFAYDQNSYDNNLDTVNARFAFYVTNPNASGYSGSNSDGPYFFMSGNGRPTERGYLAFIAGNVSSPTGGDGAIDFATGTTTRMRITPSGNVGIGTTNPSAQLTTTGESSFLGGQLKVTTNGSALSRPFVAIGFTTTQPVGYKLEVNDTLSTGAATLRLNNNATGGGLYLTKGATGIMFNGSADTWTGGGSTNDAALAAYQSNLKFFTNNNGTERMRLNSAGELMIGYTTDQGAYKLQVNSQIFATSSTIATSDRKYKTNIIDLDNGLNLLMSLKPKTYNFKQNPVHNFPTETQIGFIAQDVQEVFSNKNYLNSIVYQNNGYLGMAYDKIIPITVKAIQEQQAIIETQANEITNLKTENQNLNTLIQTLITRIEALENK